jgi:hypothetical protein
VEGRGELQVALGIGSGSSVRVDPGESS